MFPRSAAQNFAPQCSASQQTHSLCRGMVVADVAPHIFIESDDQSGESLSDRLVVLER